MGESRKSRSKSRSASLVCPSCGQSHEPSERFCHACGMPLVHPGDEAGAPVSQARQRARKINPVYAQGELVKVAYATNQAESDLVQNILLEEGIPSMARRSRGFDVPDFLAAGPRDVLVAESGAQAARELLRDADVAETVQPAAAVDQGVLGTRLMLFVLVGGALTALVAWLLMGTAS